MTGPSFHRVPAVINVFGITMLLAIIPKIVYTFSIGSFFENVRFSILVGKESTTLRTRQEHRLPRQDMLEAASSKMSELFSSAPVIQDSKLRTMTSSTETKKIRTEAFTPVRRHPDTGDEVGATSSADMSAAAAAALYAENASPSFENHPRTRNLDAKPRTLIPSPDLEVKVDEGTHVMIY
jgi:hypothetical protein